MVLFNEMREKRNTEVDEPAGQERNVVNSGNGRGGAAVNGGRGGSGIGRGVANSGNGRDGGIFFLPPSNPLYRQFLPRFCQDRGLIFSLGTIKGAFFRELPVELESSTKRPR